MNKACVKPYEIIYVRDRVYALGLDNPNLKAYAILKRLALRRSKGESVNWGVFRQYLASFGIIL